MENQNDIGDTLKIRFQREKSIHYFFIEKIFYDTDNNKLATLKATIDNKGYGALFIGDKKEYKIMKTILIEKYYEYDFNNFSKLL